MLESTQHLSNCFVTLTYSDEYVPNGGSLAKKEFQDWIKRFRKAIEPTRIRYYGVGEYGDETRRPHYHVALFGYGPCLGGRTRHSPRREKCCSTCDTIRDTWGRGYIYVGDLEVQSADYIAGYIVKKLTKKHDIRLEGREPEFGLMSLKPAIGTDALWEIASVLLHYDMDEALVDVPGVLRNSGLRPLGRTLKEKLREMIGRDKTCPPEILAEVEARVSALCEGVSFPSGDVKKTFLKNALMDEDVAKVLQQEARLKIRKARKVL